MSSYTKRISYDNSIPVSDLIRMFESERAKYATEIKENELFKWYKDVLEFDLKNIRTTAVGCLYETILVNYNGRKRWLQPSLDGEVVFGNVGPTSEDELNRMKAEAAEKGRSISVMLRPPSNKPSLKIARTSQRVETEKDGITVKEGFEFVPEKMSRFYRFIELFNDAFKIEMTTRKRANVISDNEDDRPTGKVVPSTKIVSLIHSRFSSKNPNANVAGKLMPNPYTDVSFKVVKDDDAIDAIIKDYYTASKDKNGNVLFDLYTIDGRKVNNHNIHKVFSSGTTLVRAIVDMHSVCYSNMGISIPRIVDRVVAQKKVSIQLQPGQDAPKFYNSIDISDALAFRELTIGGAKVIDEPSAPASAAASSVDDEEDICEEFA